MRCWDDKCDENMMMNMVMIRWWDEYDVMMIWWDDVKWWWIWWWIWWCKNEDVMCSLGGESLWMQHNVISSHPCSAQTEWHHGYIMWTTHHLGAIIIIMGYTLTDYFEKCHESERKSPEISSSLPSLLPSYPPLLLHLVWDGMDINQSPHQWWEYISHPAFISEYIPPVLHFAVPPPALKQTNKWIKFSHQNHLDWWDGMRCDFWKLSLKKIAWYTEDNEEDFTSHKTPHGCNMVPIPSSIIIRITTRMKIPSHLPPFPPPRPREGRMTLFERRRGRGRGGGMVLSSVFLHLPPLLLLFLFHLFLPSSSPVSSSTLLFPLPFPLLPILSLP